MNRPAQPQPVNDPPDSTRDATVDPLDPSQPAYDLPSRSTKEQNRFHGVLFRHATWQPDRVRVRAALEVAAVAPGRATAFHDCGHNSIVLKNVDDPTRYKVACLRCHDRFCLPCSQDRARLIVSNMQSQVPDEPTRFLTLTLKHNTAPLPDQIDRLYRSFRYLRRTNPWLAAVKGGVAFLELKLSKADSLWHPHLHVLLHGEFLPQKVISEAWLQITGDSHIVDIRLARSQAHVYAYLAHYVTKGWGPGLYRDQPHLVEAILALRGRKLLACFGSFNEYRLLAPPPAEDWIAIATLAELIFLAKRGVVWAALAHDAIFRSDFAPPPEPVPADT